MARFGHLLVNWVKLEDFIKEKIPVLKARYSKAIVASTLFNNYDYFSCYKNYGSKVVGIETKEKIIETISDYFGELSKSYTSTVSYILSLFNVSIFSEFKPMAKVRGILRRKYPVLFEKICGKELSSKNLQEYVRLIDGKNN
jgi:hypothetical protein